jgi:DNA-binding transcriptional regulator YdaS (Cro superfamily)
MAAVLSQADERARKNVAAIFQALSQVGQSNLAQALGVSEPTVSRMKEKDFPESAKILALCKLKVVPEHFVCVDPAYLSAIVTLAQKHMAELNPQVLRWDE